MGFRLRALKEITLIFLAKQHLHLLCCKSLKTNKFTSDLRLANEALCHYKYQRYFFKPPKSITL